MKVKKNYTANGSWIFSLRSAELVELRLPRENYFRFVYLFIFCSNIPIQSFVINMSAQCEQQLDEFGVVFNIVS